MSVSATSLSDFQVRADKGPWIKAESMAADRDVPCSFAL